MTVTITDIQFQIYIYQDKKAARSRIKSFTISKFCKTTEDIKIIRKLEGNKFVVSKCTS